MHRHIVVVSFLEWLNWHDKGSLRIVAQRMVWVPAESEAEALICSLQFAPDLEPADDAFLIAEITAPPQMITGGLLWLPLEQARFLALSERSSRLLLPAAERMSVTLHLVAPELQEAWARWKNLCRVESADKQARRLWIWAFGQTWPIDPNSPEETCLRQTATSWDAMTKLLATNVRLREQITGTSVAAWMPMVFAAEEAGLLSKGDDADWRMATRAYIASSVRSGRIAPGFLQSDDAIFQQAFEKLPCDNPAMIELIAVATGAHHALRIIGGLEPDIGALTKDLETLTDLVSGAEMGKKKTILNMALLTLGRLLPGPAVAALQARAEAAVGWVASWMDSSPEEAPPERGNCEDGGTSSCPTAETNALFTVGAEVEAAAPERYSSTSCPDADHHMDPCDEKPSASQDPSETFSLLQLERIDEGTVAVGGAVKRKPNVRSGGNKKANGSPQVAGPVVPKKPSDN